jgi:hypothetical protein
MADQKQACSSRDQQIGEHGTYEKCPRFATTVLKALRATLLVIHAARQTSNTDAAQGYHQDFFFDITNPDKDASEDRMQAKKRRNEDDEAVESAFGGGTGAALSEKQELYADGGIVSQKMTVQGDGTFEISMTEEETDEEGAFERSMGEEVGAVVEPGDRMEEDMERSIEQQSVEKQQQRIYAMEGRISGTQEKDETATEVFSPVEPASFEDSGEFVAGYFRSMKTTGELTAPSAAIAIGSIQLLTAAWRFLRLDPNRQATVGRRASECGRSGYGPTGTILCMRARKRPILRNKSGRKRIQRCWRG